METESLLPHSQVPTTWPYPEQKLVTIKYNFFPLQVHGPKVKKGSQYFITSKTQQYYIIIVILLWQNVSVFF